MQIIIYSIDKSVNDNKKYKYYFNLDNLCTENTNNNNSQLIFSCNLPFKTGKVDN